MIRLTFYLCLALAAVFFMTPAPEKSAPKPQVSRLLDIDVTAPAATGPASNDANAALIIPATLTTETAPAPTPKKRRNLISYTSSDAPASVRRKLQEDAKVLYVTANRVNLRAGPSTETAVLGQLTRGSAAEVISIEPSGWVELRNAESGLYGYMSQKFLSARAPG